MRSRDAAVCCDSRFDSICPSPGTHPRLGKWQKNRYPSRTPSIFYTWYDTGGFSSFTNFSPNIDLHIWDKDFEIWFVNPKELIPLLYCPVFVRFGPLEPFDIVLLPQQLFLDSNSAIYTTFRVFSPQILIHFFTTLIQLYSDVWCSQPSVTQTGNSDEIVFSIGKTGCIK